MLDVNMMIANNIQNQLKKENKKQIDLAEGIGVSKQTMSKIMTVRPPENLKEDLKKIAKQKGYTVNQLVLQILWDWLEFKKTGGKEDE